MKIEHLRFYIQIRFKLGIDVKEIFKELKIALPDNAPSLSTVSRWFKHFKGGRDGLEDQPRSGRPITEVIQPNIDKIDQLIEENPWITYDEIEALSSLSRGTIQTIIHDCLKLKKITSRWVPHELSEKNRKDRVRICQENLAKFKEGKWRLCDVITGDEAWFYLRQIGRKQSNASWVKEGESPRTVVRRDRYEAKFMFTLFFKSNGFVHISHLDKGKTIDNKSYIKDSLKPIVETLREQRPTYGPKNIKFHHDNARPHVHKDVKTFLERNEFILMDHPPYSPDLAPCDFWLNNYIKQRLTDHTDIQSLNSQITEIVGSISTNEYLKTFHKWIERMELCVKYKGHYFEHLINKQ